MRFALSTFGSSVLWISAVVVVAAPIADTPFWQDVAVRIHHAPELAKATYKKVCVDKENVVYVLTDKGVARVFDDMLALDRSYRPLAGKIAQNIALTPQGDLAYRFDRDWISNGGNGALDLNADTAWLSPKLLLKAQPGVPWPELTARVTARQWGRILSFVIWLIGGGRFRAARAGASLFACAARNVRSLC